MPPLEEDRMGRKKTSEVVTYEVVDNLAIRPAGNVVLKEKKTYTFRNLLPGNIFFTRETGKEDMFEGHEVKDDISEKERKIIINNGAFKLGYIVEELPDSDNDKIDNPNALSDTRIEYLIEKNRVNTDYFIEWIDNIDSTFAAKRVREFFLKANLTSSIISYCDYKINKLEEEYLETQKAPIDSDVAKGA